MDWQIVKAIDPFKLKDLLWPHVTFYKQQRQVIESVRDNDETYVPAGNMLGKDFVSGFITLWFFLSRHPCRIVTTSADHSQLESVLWGEIGRFIQTSRIPLSAEDGGPLLITHMKLRKIINGQRCKLSYCLGRVAAKGEGFLGHHIAKTGDGIPRTLILGDEASGIEDICYERSDTWADRKLFIGNCYQGPPGCTFFESHSEGGEIKSPDGDRTYRKVIRITAEDSPNVRWARAQEAAGMKPTGELIIDGVLPWHDYLKRRTTWDEMMQSIGLDAKFYKGSGVMWFPMAWLDACERYDAELMGMKRQAVALGVDSGQGSADTSITLADEYGLLEQIDEKTPDANQIVESVKRIGSLYNVPPTHWIFDAGGGGSQVADFLRGQGFPVPPAVGFGETTQVAPRGRKGRKTGKQADKEAEHKYRFYNRRAQIYWMMRELMDPSLGNRFAIPARMSELRQQLTKMPIIYDGEGRICMLPKYRKSDRLGTQKTLTDLLGRSPDQADSAVLAVWGVKGGFKRGKVGTLNQRVSGNKDHTVRNSRRINIGPFSRVRR